MESRGNPGTVQAGRGGRVGMQWQARAGTGSCGLSDGGTRPAAAGSSVPMGPISLGSSGAGPAPILAEHLARYLAEPGAELRVVGLWQGA